MNMNLEQLLLALRARYLLVIVVTVVAGLATLITCFFLPDRYKAAVAVVVDVKTADPIAGTYAPAFQQPSYMATQLDIIQSDRVADRVAQELGMDKDPKMIAKWKDDTDGKGSLLDYLGQSLGGRLDVVPSKDSNVIIINCKKYPDGKSAAACANTFARVYIETSVALRVDPAKQYSTYFEAQAQAVRERLEKAQTALSDYQRDKGIIVVSDDRLDTEFIRLSELTSQLANVQGQKSDSQSREAQTKASSDSMQEVLQSPVIAQLKGELSRQESKLNELGATLGSNHPQYRSQQDSVNSLRRELASQTQVITRGVGTNDRVNALRESDLVAAIDAQRARVLKLKQDKDAAAVLQRDVDFAQRAADAVAQRQTQSGLESQTTQTNISILSPALEPALPYTPRMVLFPALGTFAGLVIGIAIALALEWFNRRIRSISDLAGIFGLPVLGVVATERLPGNRRLLGRFRGAQRLPPPVLART